jgi:type II secretory pathway pseudopilin PulG
MIVLVIMAAATAVVWPNLQKPLRRTSLTESASQVRELLDEARNRATSRGSACFVRFETGSSRLYFGTLEQFLEDSSLSNNAAAMTNRNQPLQGSAPVRSTGGSLSPQLRLLPETVVVESFRNSIALTPNSSLEPTSDSGFVGTGREPGPDGLSQPDLQSQTAELPIERSIELGSDSQVYWLPMLASDLGRDATITLYDTQLQDSIEISYCAATGAIEILP